MCGRFALTLPVEAMAQLFAAAPGNDLPQGPNYNICPTNDVVAVLGGGDAGGRRLAALRWGFLPRWYKTPGDGPLLINARAETIAEKPAFRDACRQRRCLIPATGFYEWTKDADGARLPWYIHRADAAPVVFAGVWQAWEPKDGGAGMTTCAIVTCAANDRLSAIHHRMPVVLAPEDWGLWLGEAGRGAAPLMRPAPDDVLTYHRVDTAVNSNRARGEDLIAPVAV
ncbi:SOS response-associated peptidase [Meridianimarinicoccus sp. MJW13]|uniref:SOS response-associated peptidase n=1 Tax=Meridianimarinicoccus sp. MJW13 TaxID=2720031 RepID=UPI001865AC5C|nr:SOS response-associated peptidase [Fluviibacterium sp. MJW13]